MVKKYTPEISTPSDATEFTSVERGGAVKSSSKGTNMVFEGDLAAAVRAELAAKKSEGHEKKSWEYAQAAKNSEGISTENKDKTSVLKDTTEVASGKAKKSEEKSKKILEENIKKEKKVAENLDAVGNLAKEVALKERQTSDTLRGAEEAKAAAENAAKEAIAAARVMGEPQQRQIV